MKGFFNKFFKNDLFSKNLQKKIEFLTEEEALQDLISTMNNIISFESAVQKIIAEIACVFQVERCFFVGFNSDTKDFLPVQDYAVNLTSLNVKNTIGLKLNSADLESFYKILFQQKQILEVNAINYTNISEKAKNKFLEYELCSFIAVPVICYYKILGIIFIDTCGKDISLSSKDKNFLLSIGNLLALVVRRNILQEKITKLEKEQNIYQIMNKTVWSKYELSTALNIISKEVISLFNVDTVLFIEFPDKYNLSYWRVKNIFSDLKDIPVYQPASLTQEERDLVSDLIFSRDDIKILENIEITVIPEALKKHFEKFEIKSLVSIPLKKDKDFWGTLVTFQSEIRKFTKDEISALNTISAQIYLAIKDSSLCSLTNKIIKRNNIIKNITNKSLVSRNFEDALDIIAEDLGVLFGVDRVEIRIFDPMLNQFSDTLGEYRISEVISSNKYTGCQTKELEEFMLKELFESKQSIIFENIKTANIPENIKDIFKHSNIYSAIMFPILQKNYPIAILILSNVIENKPVNTDYYDILIPVGEQINLITDIFQLNDKLAMTLNNERAIRSLIVESKSFDDFERIFSSLIEKMFELFNIDRALLLHFDENRNLSVYSEVCKSVKMEKLINQVILTSASTKELEPRKLNEVIIVNDVNYEIKDETLREYLINKDIQAFLMYPMKISAKNEYEEEKVNAISMLCSATPRRWNSLEIDSFKLAADTTELAYLQAIQKKETEKTKQTFLATLTHDLRSPINGEQKALEFLLSRKHEMPIGDYFEFLEDIYKTNEELLRIVNNILMVYHYETGKPILNIISDKIDDVINDTMHSMRHLAKSNDSSINIEFEEGLPYALMDKNEIQRVILNLVSNAIKHNTKGTSINIKVRKVNEEIEVSVEDNGRGIPENEKKNIFQRYPTEKRYVGTGLGLFLSKQIIEAHNGKIWFTTEEGKGTTFYFRLPVAETDKTR